MAADSALWRRRGHGIPSWLATRASGGIGRRAGFRFLCPKGCEGSSPSSRTTHAAVHRFTEVRGRGAVHDVGTIQEIWRYPVKSLGGEGVGAVDLDQLGVPGD